MFITDFIIRAEHKIYVTIKKLRLKNRDFTILADNCNGGIILHDLCMRFNTPIINLYFLPADYLRFLKNPKKYIGKEPVEIKIDGIGFPIGRIDDVTVYFMHYKTFEDAKLKWLERSQRVNFDNLYILMTDKNGCTELQMREFNTLPYKHKVLFTHLPHPELKTAVHMKGYEDDNEVGILSDFKPGFWRRRYLDDFDYVSFLNQRN